MKTINCILRCKVLCGILPSLMFLLVCFCPASAQQSAGGTVNPYTYMGQKIGVASYPFGTFDRDQAMTGLQAILTQLKGVLSGGGGTGYQKLKYAYCSAVYADIHTLHIAPEITLLTSLAGLNAGRSTVGIQNVQLVSLYNEVVAQIQ